MQTTFAFKYILIKYLKMFMLFANYPFAQSKIIGSVSWYAFIMVSQIPDQLKYEFLPLSYFACSPLLIDEQWGGGRSWSNNTKHNVYFDFLYELFFVKSIRKGIYSKSCSTVNAPFVIVIFPLFSHYFHSSKF